MGFALLGPLSLGVLERKDPTIQGLCTMKFLSCISLEVVLQDEAVEASGCQVEWLSGSQRCARKGERRKVTKP